MTTKKKTSKKETKKDFDFRTIKTVPDAFKKCGYTPDQVPDLTRVPEKLKLSIETGFLLMVVFQAINNGWEPDYTNINQAKYYPWPWVLSSGLGFSGSFYRYDYAHSFVGSRLCTDTSEKALYILNQFPDLWKNWLLNVKSE
jgi:hypothetical protein